MLLLGGLYRRFRLRCSEIHLVAYRVSFRSSPSLYERFWPLTDLIAGELPLATSLSLTSIKKLGRIDGT